MDTKVNGTHCEGHVTIHQESRKDGLSGRKSWEGDLIVPRDLFDEPYLLWGGKTVEYDGPFEYDGDITSGKGKAFITFAIEHREDGPISINIEGSGAPELKDDII